MTATLMKSEIEEIARDVLESYKIGNIPMRLYPKALKPYARIGLFSSIAGAAKEAVPSNDEMGRVTDAILEAFNVFGENGYVFYATIIMGKCRLPAEAYSRGIALCLEKGEYEKLAGLMRKYGLPEELYLGILDATLDKDLRARLSSYEITLPIFKRAGLPESVYLRAIELVGEEHFADERANLLKVNGLTSRVYLKGIEAAIKAGNAVDIAKLGGRTDVPDGIRAYISPAVMQALEVCSERAMVEKIAEIWRYHSEVLSEDAKAELTPMMLRTLEPYVLESGGFRYSPGRTDELERLVKWGNMPAEVHVKGIEVLSAGVGYYDNYKHYFMFEILVPIMKRDGLAKEVYVKAIELYGEGYETFLSNDGRKAIGAASKEESWLQELRKMAAEGGFGGIIELAGKAGVHEALGQHIPAALERALEVCAETGREHVISDAVYGKWRSSWRASNDETIRIRLKAIEICAEKGWMSRLAGLASPKAMGLLEIKKRATTALIRALEVCVRNEDINEIRTAMERYSLPEEVFITVLGLYGRTKCADEYVLNCMDRPGHSEKVYCAAITALFSAGKGEAIGELMEMRDFPESAREAAGRAIKACGERARAQTAMGVSSLVPSALKKPPAVPRPTGRGVVPPRIPRPNVGGGAKPPAVPPRVPTRLNRK